MKPFTYLIIDLGCIIIPFIASFYPKHAFYQHWGAFFRANFVVGLLFLVWDYFFTKAGIWGFNLDYLTQIQITNLPIEEVLFFICIPYACVFTYFALKYLLPDIGSTKYQSYFSLILIAVLTIVGLSSLDLWYTSVTFLTTAGYLLYSLYTRKDLSYVYWSYVLILPFFFMSNGLLTGYGLDAPIVWYNDMENLGIRMWTIPVEDSIYGFLLIALNIELFEYFRK